MTATFQLADLDGAGLDQILTLQILVAWAGESDTDPPRLRWWRSAMCDEYAGEDLFQRLLPHTWRWAVLETARAAARRVDARARERAADAGQLVSLFHLGFELDERLEDHLRALKRAEHAPLDALPGLKPVAHAWSESSLAAWLEEMPKAEHVVSPTGRRIKATIPSDPVRAARLLCSALRPLGESYPLPHFRVG